MHQKSFNLFSGVFWCPGYFVFNTWNRNFTCISICFYLLFVVVDTILGYHVSIFFKKFKSQQFRFEIELQYQPPSSVLVANNQRQFQFFDVDRLYSGEFFNPTICIENAIFKIMLCTTAFKKVLCHRGTFFWWFEIRVINCWLLWHK